MRNRPFDPNLRIAAITHLVEGRLTIGEVASRLELSERQVQRLLSRFLERGASGLIHGHTGRRPANALDLGTVERAQNLAATKYANFNHTQTADMFAEEEDLHIPRRTLTRYLNANDQKSPKTHRVKTHRRRRERRPQAGIMVQADGSEHAWVEDRGPKFCLIAGVDDATSRPWAHFSKSEDSRAYFQLLWMIVMDAGVPHSWYCDRDSIFSVNRTFQGDDPFFTDAKQTQFGRALGQLGMELILTKKGPQGKGRIERFFDTAQDRLVSLLRLHNARTIEDARRVLPRFLSDYEKRFSVAARDPEPAWLPWPDHLLHNEVFCFTYKRKLGRDSTISLHGSLYDVPPVANLRPGTELVVRQQFDHTVQIFHGTELLGFYDPSPPSDGPRVPSPNHPWRLA